MAEQFANAAASTLTASVGPGDTTLKVYSASSFPAAGTFRVLVEQEIMTVTAVSGNTFTVTRASENWAGGAAAVSHNAGVTVSHILTAASLQNAFSLPAVGTPGTYGDATHYPVVTTDTQGRVTGVTTQAVSGGPTTANANVTADVSVSGFVFVNVTGLSFAVGANETWSVEFHLRTGTSASFNLIGPASPTFVRTQTTGVLNNGTGYGDSTGVGFGADTTGFVAGSVTLKALVQNAGNAGTVQLQFLGVFGAAATVLQGSYMVARRIPS